MNITFDRPWSEVGIEVAGQDVGSAVHEAGMDFTVSVRQAYYRKAPSVYPKAAGYNLIVRDDIGEPLGACKDGYVPIQNSTMVGIVESLTDICSLDTIGNFNNGSKVWMMLRLNDSRVHVTEQDSIEQYLLLVNGHDAVTSFQMGVIPFRLSCSNMLPRVGKYMVKLNHTSGVRGKVRSIKHKLHDYVEESKNFTLDMKSLVNKRCYDPTMYFGLALGLKDTGRGRATSKKLLKLFSDGRGQEEVSGTWYAAFNAVTEYLNYESGRGQETRLKSLWFGKNDKVNNKAYSLAMEMSA